ncbi:hypothetical protein GLOTRDRAFT_73944 [Gloeophyllum trabeum ATCC 11539]|uniref:T6SS Phospholipase effector Tle1-like catalytic domain-containing protein n=1 Tax=Gloeophyllum trabeum (strain ATCC 11539 / FP-39264 / Madison 617) TaxID=670483 RepID=S7RVJ1_GLOTA|nr:uncharacterized protein GLOTRDRAFT_73944 [Gloeophyllum trabeum ATCC 11539]EPQ57274.1 hypothetical protein GLOTRDRAFT_73944 [Gloeophyllum trabeum ATCC 11539]
MSDSCNTRKVVYGRVPSARESHTRFSSSRETHGDFSDTREDYEVAESEVREYFTGGKAQDSFRDPRGIQHSPFDHRRETLPPQSHTHDSDVDVSFETECDYGGKEVEPCTPDCAWAPEENRKWISAGTPSREGGRTIVLLFDGTSDSFDSTNSNVVRLTSFLRKDDTTKQLVYYQTGIGTYTDPWIVTPIVSKMSMVLDTMFAFTLDSHMKHGYKFLMDNYTAGDRICIFGFTRGAYTARALAGMLRKIGLLSKGNCEHLPFAYTMYKRDDPSSEIMSSMFKQTFSIDVKIDFVGVWDTVASTGLVTKDLPFVNTNDGIRVFRHALALDERRGKFIPTFYRQSNDTSAASGDETKTTDAKEVWFAGAHCDVGGGSVKNSERHSLARIPLRWMIRECFRANTGIIFDAELLRDEAGLDMVPLKGSVTVSERPLPLQPLASAFFKFWWSLLTFPYKLFFGRYEPAEEVIAKAPLGEAEEELRDAVQPVYDQMELHWLWRLIDRIPFRAKKYNESDEKKDTYQWVLNFGFSRKIHKPIMDRGKIKVHRSVKTRLEAQESYGNANRVPYIPRVRPNFGGSGEPRQLSLADWNVESASWFEWEA